MDVQYIIEMWLFVAAVSCLMDRSEGMSPGDKKKLRDQVVEMFHHAYNSYMDNAFPADELMPLSCKGRDRGTMPSRGDVDDALGNFSLTLVDTLDTLVVLGEVETFDKAVRLVIQHVTFDRDVVVSVFETNIRMVGGLLSGHVLAKYLKRKKLGLDWYQDELLEKAKELGYRLLPAFNTTTGIPFPRVNLRHGVLPELARTGHEKDTCTACAGTMILEFAALSRLTGEPIFEEKAQRAMEMLWKARHRTSNLVGTVINIHNGDWVRRESGVGAGIDSYYEYLLKAYILLGEETYLDRFNKHYAAIMKYVNQGPLLVDVHMHKPLTNSRNFMDALLAFWPGLQVLKGDIKPAIEIHEILYQVTQRHNFLPEAFTTDFRVHWPQHPLRPEFVESTYLIYKATGDPHYHDVGKTVIDNLNQHARVDCGFASIRDVTTGTKEDQMDSFVLAETFKYLYLLFSEKEDLLIDIDDYIFTTEAHMLPLSLAMTNLKTNASEKSYLFPSYDEDDDDNYERSCPNTNHLFRGNVNFAQALRTPLKNMVENLCPKPRTGRRPRLHASQFMAGNKEQLEELKRMGIRLVTMNDGRVQLLHTASDAASPDDAEDGMHFMQEMIELSKTQAQEAQQEARVIQFVSAPFLGSVVLNSGPAQFGPDLRNNDGMIGKVVVTEPFRACQPIQNADVVRGKIAIAERGDCMFIDKARHIEAAGAIAGIITDNKVDTNSDTTPMFAMSGDGTDDIGIPFTFLFYTEGRNLLQTAILYDTLQVHIGVQPKNTESIQRWIEAETSEESQDDTELNDGECQVSENPDLISRQSPMTSHSGDDIDKEYDVSSDLKLLLEKIANSMKADDILDKVDLELETKDEVEAFFRYLEHTKHFSHFTVQVGSDAATDTNDRKANMLKQLIRLGSGKTNGDDSKLDILSKHVDTILQAKHEKNGNDGQSVYKANHEDRSFSSVTETSHGEGIHVKITSGVADSGEDRMEKTFEEALDDYFNTKLLTLFGETSAGNEQDKDSDWNEKPSPTEAPSYATPEDLSAWHSQEQNPRARVKKAPEWMGLRDGELFVDRNGKIFSNDGEDSDPSDTPTLNTDNTQSQQPDDSGISSGDEDGVENYKDKPVHRTLEFVSFGSLEDPVSLEKDLEESPSSEVDSDDAQALHDDGENIAGDLQVSRDMEERGAGNSNQHFRPVPEAEEYYDNRNQEIAYGQEGSVETKDALADPNSLHNNDYSSDSQDNLFHQYVPSQDNIEVDPASLQDQSKPTVLIGNHESPGSESAQETTSISSSEVDASLPVESGQHRTKQLTEVEPDIRVSGSSSGQSRTNIGDLEQEYPDYQNDEL